MTKIASLARALLFAVLAANLTAPVLGQTRSDNFATADQPAQTPTPTRAVTSLPAVRQPAEQSAGEKSLSRPQADAMRVLSTSARGVVLDFTADGFSTVSTETGVAVSVSGFDRLAQPGEPDLPSRVIFVGVPQTGGVRLNVSTEGTQTSMGVQVSPAVGFDGSNQQIKQSVLAGSGFWPAAPAEILSIETLRGVRVAKVRVSPAQYDAATKTLRLHRTVRVSLAFDRPAVQNDRPDALDDVVKSMLVNGADAVGWKLDLPQDSTNFFERSNVWCRIKTESTGVYRITAADLKAAGFSPESIAPATMKLYSIGPHTINGPYPDTMLEVPVYVKDNGDAKFDKGEYLAFYAEAPSYWQVSDSLRLTNDSVWRTNAFTDYSAWWLTWGGENGRRMTTVSGAGATNPLPDAYEHIRLEPDSLCPARSGLLWLWKDIVKIAGIDETAAVEIKLPQRETIYSVSGRFYGRADKDVSYKILLYLNHTLLDSLSVDAGTTIRPAANFTLHGIPSGAAARLGKTDTLQVGLYGDQAMDVFLDFVEVRYSEKLTVTKAAPQLEFLAEEGSGAEFGIEGANGDALVFDVTEPYSPVLITDTDVSGGRRNLRLSASGFRRLRCALSSGLLAPKEVARRSPGGLRDPALTGDYFVVCPDDFYHAGELFARYREGNVAGIQNARVRVVKLSEVYDDYAFGIEEPGAIKRLLQAKRPSYVLLAGDGTYDYRNILQLRTSPVLPPFEAGYDIDPEVYNGNVRALDAWYADLNGDGSVPDLILGRITVRSAVEFRQFLDRVKRYETQPLGYWAKRYLLLADDEIEGSYDRPDGLAHSHVDGSEGQAAISAGLLDPVKVYLTEYPLTATNLKAGASVEFIRQLNAGAVLFCFFGHGAGFQLCHEQVLHITNTVPSVNNGSRSPMAFYGSCGVGRFEDTRYEAIAEELVRRDGGTIAGVAATKATGAGDNQNLADAMFRRLVTYPDDPIGPAFLQGFIAGHMSHECLFGDPATVLRMPHRGLVPEVSPDTFYPGGRNELEATDTANTKGLYEVSVHEALWYREYHSTYTNGNKFDEYYTLPGYEIHHAGGTFDTSRILGSFIVPRMQYPETTDVANGRYIRLPNTGRVSLLSVGGSAALSSERDSITLDSTMVSTLDNEPPLVGLYADRISLVPGDTNRVPRGFDLVGRLSDPSGIFLVPNMDPSVQDVVLSLKMGGTTTPLAGYFHYDNNSTVRGQFTYPLELENALDSITVTAADNMVDPTNPGQNRARVTVLLKTQLNDALELADCLVYPNPTKGAANFTFSLNRAAFVSVKIFTIAGRPVRALPQVPCGFGYNQLEWDGLDKDGQPLANGVYLYKLDARVTETSSAGARSAATSFRDKFIVYR